MENKALDRPFDPAVWAKAMELAERYSIEVGPKQDGDYYGRVVEMPLVMADGTNRAGCVMEVLEALTAVLATDLERGETSPPPGEKW